MADHTGDIVVIVIVVGALAIGLISMAIGQVARLWEWLVDWRPVKHSQESDTEVMSRHPISEAPSTPLSQRQTAPQTDRPSAPPEPPREIMLDMFRLMRAYGIPREKARPILKAAGWKLDNNLWTEAAPPDDAYTTPIAGRTTRAQFDPDYPYEPMN